jgi:uncharacterized repeat protein (TIGR01451 family)
MTASVRGVTAAVFISLIAVAAAAQSADMFVVKSGPNSAAPGANITYAITVGNAGPDTATVAGFTDTLPAGTTFVSVSQLTGPAFSPCSDPGVGNSGTVTCTAATLASGASADFNLVVKIDPSTPGGTLIINTATTTSTTPDDNSENDSSVAGTSVSGGNQADVSIVKTGPNSAPANSDVSYTITVTNGGPNDATNVSWTDTLPAGSPTSPMTFVSFTQNSGPTFNCGVPSATTTCTIATLPLSATATFTFVGHIPNGTASGTTYTNQVTMTSDNDPNPDNDASATALTVSSVDVGVTKSGPATAVAGGPTFDYVVTLSNAGPDAANDASFSDALPAGINFVSLVQDTGPAAACNTPSPNSGGTVACTISLLPNGGSAQFTITVQAAPTVANGTVVSNTATASTSSADSNPANDSSTVSTTVSTQADVSITKSAPATANAGTNITYTITVANAGPSDAASVSWSDTLPAGTTFVSEAQATGPAFSCTTGATISCSIATLAAGTSATFTVVVHISSATPSGTTISNTATVASTTTDLTPGNNSSTASTTTTASADVGVTKSGPAAALAGSNVTYTIAVANGGPSDAASVTLNDALPPNTTFVSLGQSGPSFSCTTPAVGASGTVNCSIVSLAAGSTTTFTLVVNFSASIPDGTTVTNTATVASTTTDPNSANNSESSSAVVGANADLSVTKSGPATTPSNTNITYTVTVANGGPSNATTVTLTETVPAGMAFVSVNQTSGPSFSCSGTGPIVCTIATFPAGASASFDFTFNVLRTAAPGTVATNTATISAATLDPNPGNNSASATTTIGQSIPALSPLAMALLAVALAAFGAVAVRMR